MEFSENENGVFDEVMNLLHQYPAFRKYELQDSPILSLPGLEICPNRRKIFRNKQEIYLTTKEFDIFCLLAVNRERVVTYGQIYQKIWKEFSTGGENRIVGYHVRNLRKKLGFVSDFSIQCIREVGYCFQIDKSKQSE